ncbi:MAG: hypothetical protein HQK53_13810 [Oligoflexia bacterium]|nr:hypothetical protein [Oligoflexia bacterium]
MAAGIWDGGAAAGGAGVGTHLGGGFSGGDNNFSSNLRSAYASRFSSDPPPLVGDIPPIEGYGDDFISKTHSGYRHSIFFNVRHYYTSSQSYAGSVRFAQQITGSGGLFDYLDAPRNKVHIIGSNATQGGIPDTNTIEFRLLNSLFTKTINAYDYNQDGGYMQNNFSYSKVASFNISQGITLNTGEPRFVDNLTRLVVDGGFPIWSWGFGFSDTYFYQTQKHRLNVSLSRGFDFFGLNFNAVYDSISTPVTKNWNFNTSIQALATVQLGFAYSFDLVKKEYTGATYSLRYTPVSNCWKFALDYKSAPGQAEKEILFNLWLNFGGGYYTSIFSAIPGVSYQ